MTASTPEIVTPMIVLMIDTSVLVEKPPIRYMVTIVVRVATIMAAHIGDRPLYLRRAVQ